MTKKNFIFLFVLVLISTSIHAQSIRDNLSSDPDGIDSFNSTITYSQEEKEKRFIGNFKLNFKKIRDFTFNIIAETSEISDGIGAIGIFNPFDINNIKISKGAKLKAGIIFSNYEKKLELVTIEQVANERVRLAKENKWHQYKKPEDLLRYQPSYLAYKDQYKGKEIDLLNEIKAKMKVMPKETFGKESNEKPELLYDSSLDCIASFEKLIEFIEKRKEDDPKNVGTRNSFINFIAQKRESLKIDTINSIVDEYNLYKFETLQNSPDEIKKELSDFHDSLLSGVWKASINAGVNYTGIKYLDPENGFNEVEDRIYGLSIQAKFGIFFKASSVLGVIYEYENTSKLPLAQTISQEMLINEQHAVPQTWVSKSVFLSKLLHVKTSKFIFEYRKHYSSRFALNPFAKLNYIDSKLSEIDLSVNLLLSLDKDNKWNIGIQPGLNWSKEEGETFGKSKFSISLFLTSAFKLFDY